MPRNGRVPGSEFGMEPRGAILAFPSCFASMERDPRWRSDERITAAKVKVLAVTAAPTTRKASSPTVTVISSNGFICCLSLSATPHNTRVRFARLSLIVDIIDKIRLSVPPGELGYDSRSDVPVDLRCGAHNGGRSSATPSQRVTPELAELAPPFRFDFVAATVRAFQASRAYLVIWTRIRRLLLGTFRAKKRHSVCRLERW